VSAQQAEREQEHFATHPNVSTEELHQAVLAVMAAASSVSMAALPVGRTGSSSRPLLAGGGASGGSSSESEDDDSLVQAKLRHHGGHMRFYGRQRKLLGLGTGVLVGTEHGTMQGEKVLAADASDVDAFYSGWLITTENPRGQGRVGKYDGATKAITVMWRSNATTTDATTYTITNATWRSTLTRRAFCDFGIDGQQMAPLSRGSAMMLFVQLVWAVVLTAYCTQTVWSFECPDCDLDNQTGQLSEHEEDMFDFSAEEAERLWLVGRLISFLCFIWLSVAQRWLLLSVTRYPPRGRMIGKSNFREANYREEIEVEAKDLCLWLWLPLAVVSFAWLGVSSAHVRALWVLLQDLIPAINVGATALLLGARCTVIRAHVERVVRDTLALSVEDATPLMMDDRAASSAGRSGGLLQQLTVVKAEVERVGHVWRWCMGAQIALVVAILVNCVSAILHRRGIGLVSRVDLTGDVHRFEFVLMQVVPMMWAVFISFSAIVRLNTYLESIPSRISRESNFDITLRCAFADEYERLEMFLEIPLVGKLTEGKRLSAMLSFVGVVSLALSFPGQIADALAIKP
jgi:hypothetical protein